MEHVFERNVSLKEMFHSIRNVLPIFFACLTLPESDSFSWPDSDVEFLVNLLSGQPEPGLLPLHASVIVN